MAFLIIRLLARVCCCFTFIAICLFADFSLIIFPCPPMPPARRRYCSRCWCQLSFSFVYYCRLRVAYYCCYAIFDFADAAPCCYFFICCYDAYAALSPLRDAFAAARCWCFMFYTHWFDAPARYVCYADAMSAHVYFDADACLWCCPHADYAAMRFKRRRLDVSRDLCRYAPAPVTFRVDARLCVRQRHHVSDMRVYALRYAAADAIMLPLMLLIIYMPLWCRLCYIILRLFSMFYYAPPCWLFRRVRAAIYTADKMIARPWCRQMPRAARARYVRL